MRSFFEPSDVNNRMIRKDKLLSMQLCGHVEWCREGESNPHEVAFAGF